VVILLLWILSLIALVMSKPFVKLTWEKFSLDTFEWEIVSDDHDFSQLDYKDYDAGDELNIGHLNVMVSYPVLGPQNNEITRTISTHCLEDNGGQSQV
jgi:hypothetical protein